MSLPFHPKAIVFLFCLFYINSSNAQKPYTSGQFVINEELEKNNEADEAEYDRLKNSPFLKRQLYNQSTHYVFNDSMVARVVTDSLGIIQSRIVWNFNSLQRIRISREQGKLYHQIFKIKLDHLSKNLVNERFIGGKFGKKIHPMQRKEHQIGSWNVVSFQKNASYSDVGDFSYTSEIEMPYTKYVRPKAENEVDSNIVILKRWFFDNRRIWILKRLENFTQEIRNPEWLDENVEEIPNMSKYRYDPEKDVIKRKVNIYAKIPNAAKNTDIAVELINKKRLSALYYGELKKGGILSDLIIKVETYEIGDELNSAEAKLEDMLALGLISQNDVDYLSSGFSNNNNWNLRQRKNFCDLYFLNQELQNRTFRTNIIANLEENGYSFNPRKGEDTLFLNGTINLGKMLSTEPRIIPTTNPKVIPIQPQKIVNEIKLIVEPVLISMGVNYEITSDLSDGRVTIYSGGIEYKIDFSEDINNLDETEDKRIHIEKELVEKWINPLRQIAADQNYEYAIGTSNWIKRIMNTMRVEDYDEIVLKYPELKLVDHTIYVLAYPKKDFWKDKHLLDVEIHHSDKQKIVDQYYFSSFIGVIEAGVDYVTTNQKKDFLKHIKKYKKEYKLEKEDIIEIENRLFNELVRDVYMLLNWIPSVRESPYLARSIPDIDPKKNDFKDVFPSLDKFINGDFKAKNLKVDPLSKYILEMKYKGEIVGLEKRNNNVRASLINFLNNYLREKETGIYTYEHPLSGNTQYLYLTEEQRLELQRIFKFRLKK